MGVGTVTTVAAVTIMLGALVAVRMIENRGNNRKGEPEVIDAKRLRSLVNRLPLIGQRLAWVDFYRGGSSDDEEQDRAVVVGAPLEAANVMTSLMDIPALEGEPMHRPVIDIDHRAVVVESSTGGHSHLYIDLMMPWGDYLKLLDVMVEVGLVEPGYVNASRARGYTAVRLPWVSKHDLSDEEVRGA